MAARNSGSGNRLTNAGNPTRNSFTWMFWLYLLGHGITEWPTFISLIGDRAPCVQLNQGGYAIVIGETLNDTAIGSTLSLNTWYHIAWVRASTTNNRLYVNGVIDITDLTTQIGGTTEAGICYYDQALSTLWSDCRIAYSKIWNNVQLSAEEILNEMNSIRPVRTDGLWAFYPHMPDASERLADYSGNGRTLSQTGTITDEDPPPVSWVVGSPFVGNSIGPAYGYSPRIKIHS